MVKPSRTGLVVAHRVNGLAGLRVAVDAGEIADVLVTEREHAVG